MVDSFSFFILFLSHWWSCLPIILFYFFNLQASVFFFLLSSPSSSSKRQPHYSLLLLSHWASSSYFLQAIIHVHVHNYDYDPTILPCCCFFSFLFHSCYSINRYRTFFFSSMFTLSLPFLQRQIIATTIRTHSHGWFLYFSPHDDDDDCDLHYICT